MVVPFSEAENSEQKQNWKDRKERKLDLTHDQIKYVQDTQAEKAGGNQIQETRVQAREKKKRTRVHTKDLVQKKRTGNVTR